MKNGAGYPLEIDDRVYVTTARFDCRGTVSDIGPMGFILRDAERVFDSGDLEKFLAGGKAFSAEPLGDLHFIAWFACAEATVLAASR